MKLRAYQERSIEMLREALRSGSRKPILVLPTGAGKSVIFGKMIRTIAEKGKRILWLVHRRNLVYQMRDVLQQFGLEPGIIMAGNDPDMDNQVQIGTIQTYRKRADLYEYDRYFMNFEVLLIDECHRSLSKTYREVIDIYNDSILIGCTATPMRSDQRGLGEVYDKIVAPVSVSELTADGYLSPPRYFAPSAPDLQGVPTRMGDYVVSDLELRVNKDKLNGDVVENWLRAGEGRKTIVFAVNVRHSIALCEKFLRYGVDAEHLDAYSSDAERDAVFQRVQDGKTKVICNVALYQEGLDVPDVSCIVMARPTKSVGLWRQCAGRGLRPFK